MMILRWLYTPPFDDAVRKKRKSKFKQYHAIYGGLLRYDGDEH